MPPVPEKYRRENAPKNPTNGWMISALEANRLAGVRFKDGSAIPSIRGSDDAAKPAALVRLLKQLGYDVSAKAESKQKAER